PIHIIGGCSLFQVHAPQFVFRFVFGSNMNTNRARRTEKCDLPIITVVIIESSAPTRIDLAGGTIDIWPLYLFHPGAQTVNAAVDLYARCRVETDGSGYVIESRDTGARLEVPSLEALANDRTLELLSRLV